MTKQLLKAASAGVGHRVPLDSRRTHLEADRNSYLARSEDYARMTLPYLLPIVQSGPGGHNRGDEANQHGFDSVGAKVTNSLSNKLALTLFPPQSSFFRMDFTEKAEKELEAAGYEVTELAKILAIGETRAMKVFSSRSTRVAIIDVMKNLVVSGNCTLFLNPDKDKPIKAIPLNRYFVKRDRSGFVVEFMTEDYKTYDTLDQDIKDAIRPHKQCQDNDNLKLLTWAYWSEGEYHILQTVEDILVKKVQKVRKEDLPWIVLTWNLAYGESYGRGLVEDNAGDFYVMEFLSEARAKGAALLADIKYLIRPGSTIDIDELVESPSGEYIFGDINDIGILQLERYADFTPISAILQEYEQRLGSAFLVSSSQRRQAERVTAYEVRLDAQELEVSLGGAYSMLSDTLQRPLASFLFKEIDFPEDLGDGIEPVITTGLEALGRIGDLEKIAQFSEMMQIPNSWPQPVLARMKWDEYTNSIQASLSLEAPWLMTEEEFQEQQSQAQEAQQQQMIAQEAAKAAPAVLESQILGSNE